VQQQCDPVGAGPHVGLQVSETEPDDPVHRGQRVLQPGRRGAAVRERDRPAGVEEREPGRHGRQHA
jgi:hypothetical protein